MHAFFEDFKNKTNRQFILVISYKNQNITWYFIRDHSNKIIIVCAANKNTIRRVLTFAYIEHKYIVCFIECMLHRALRTSI